MIGVLCGVASSTTPSLPTPLPSGSAIRSPPGTHGLWPWWVLHGRSSMLRCQLAVLGWLALAKPVGLGGFVVVGL